MTDAASAQQVKLIGEYEKAVEKVKSFQKEVSSAAEARQKLDGQSRENKVVLDELKQLSEDGKVFKLIGPALVPQEVPESVATIEKRLNYIRAELKRLDNTAVELDKKESAARDNVSALQAKLQKLRSG